LITFYKKIDTIKVEKLHIPFISEKGKTFILSGEYKTPKCIRNARKELVSLDPKSLTNMFLDEKGSLVKLLIKPYFEFHFDDVEL
jgi:hypothetical protein